MTMISINAFDADLESQDEKGKRHRHQCRVVGVTDNDQFVVIAENDGRLGTFTVPTVWPCGSGK